MKHWKSIFNTESEDSSWEIVNYTREKKIHLIFFPDPDENEIKEFKLTYAQFEELIKFAKSLDREI